MILTDFEKLKTRIQIAQSIAITPDEVYVIEETKQIEGALYILDNFKGYNFVLQFNHIPTRQEVREQVKDLYLCGVEIDFNEEMDAIENSY